VKVVTRNRAEGDARVNEVHEVTFCDKVRALELLAQHLGLLVEKAEYQGTVGRERGRANVSHGRFASISTSTRRSRRRTSAVL
jgi:hypothetical protein